MKLIKCMVLMDKSYSRTAGIKMKQFLHETIFLKLNLLNDLKNII